MLIPCYPDRPGFEPLGMLTAEEDFKAVDNLLFANKPRTIIEVGTWCGGMTLLLRDYAERIFCVDHWHGSVGDNTETYIARAGGPAAVFETFCKNMGERLFTTVFPVVGESRHIAKIWPAHLPADMAYIDAGHEYPDVSADIAAWRKHVRPGGVLAGHDYSPQFPGVVRAVDEIGKDGVEGAVWWKRL
jgi:predicted O-methyltransferase YrrM